jgi:hypothetical protein
MVLVTCWRPGRRVGVGHDDINLERNQFGRKSGEPLELPSADRNSITTLRPST